MNSWDRQEATTLVVAVVAELLKVASIQTGRPGSDARRAAGALIADAELLIETAAIAAPLADVFDKTRLAGCTFDQFDAVRQNTLAVTVTGWPALSLQNTCVRLNLVQCSYVLAATDFKSRPEVDRYMDRVNAAFEQAEVVAGDSHDQASYRSIIALHAAVTFDLTSRARPLPNIVVYDFQSTKAALWLANRLYYDAERAPELVDENRPVHPAFMQMPVRALSQ